MIYSFHSFVEYSNESRFNPSFIKETYQMGLLKRDLDDSAYDPVEDDMRGVISTARLISGHML